MSASPAALEAEEQQPKKIAFRFCRECANLLYPEEDRANNRLNFICKTCKYNEPAASACVFRHELSNTVGETAGITQDVGQDPTVGLPDFCTMCGQEIFCEVCGQETDRGFWLEVDDDDVAAMAVCTPTPPITDPPSPDDNHQHYPPNSQQELQPQQPRTDTGPSQQNHVVDSISQQLNQHRLDSDNPTNPNSQQEEAITRRQ